MQRHAALGIEMYQRAAVDALRHLRTPALHAKVKLPLQKGLLPLRHVLGDDKARLLQAFKHVGKDGADGGHALHIVERVFEACICRVKLAQLRHTCGRQCFKKDDDAADGFFRQGCWGAQGVFHGEGFTGR